MSEPLFEGLILSCVGEAASSVQEGQWKVSINPYQKTLFVGRAANIVQLNLLRLKSND